MIYILWLTVCDKSLWLKFYDLNFVTTFFLESESGSNRDSSFSDSSNSDISNRDSSNNDSSNSDSNNSDSSNSDSSKSFCVTPRTFAL